MFVGSPEFGDHDAEGLDESATTCFLCNVTFKNAELTAQHLHHVHMKWVKRTVRSADQMPEVTSQVSYFSVRFCTLGLLIYVHMHVYMIMSNRTFLFRCVL